MIVFEKEGVQHHLNFPNRCFFCFVKISSDFDGVSYGTCAGIQFPVQWFQQVFNHLVPEPDKNSIQFGKSPPICANCGTLLEMLHAALVQLASVTIQVKSRIYNLGNNAVNKDQRVHDFGTDFRNASVGSGPYQEVLNILEKIGHEPFPSWMTWFQDFASPRNFTDSRQDGEVLEWNQHGFHSGTKAAGSRGEFLEIEILDKEEPGFVEDLEKKEPGLFQDEMECDLGQENDDDDYESSDEEEEMDMEEEPIPVSTLESREQDPLTDPGSSQKAFVPEAKVVDNLKTVKDLLLQGISKPQESTRLCDFCREPVIVRHLLNHVRGHVGDYAKPCPNASCDHVFALFTSLKLHVKRSSCCRGLFDDDISVCEICNHRGVNTKILLKHLKTKHETAEKPYPCPVSGCSERFTLRQSVNCHLYSHVVTKRKDVIPPAVQPCPDCGVEFPPRYIKNHLINHHGTCPESVITCKYCPFMFPSRDKLVHHCEVHFQQGMKLECDMCQDKTLFDSLIPLRKHYFLVHKVGVVEFLCEYCNKGFFQHRSYRNHVASKHPGEVAGVSSTPNPQGEKRKLDQEVILGHSNQSCDFCGQSVNLADILKHVRGHVGDFALPCPNPMCRCVFSNISKLNNHTREVQRCRPFMTTDISTCDVCGHKATNILSLRGHLLVVHETAEKPYPCPVTGCLHRFTHRQTVQYHIVLHTSSAKGKPASFKQAPPSHQACPTCQVHLPQDEIRGHLEKVHGALPDSIVSCNYCRYLFPSRDKMIEHWAFHITSGIPVSCDLCSDDEKFLSSRVLRDHYWTKHQVGRPRVVCEHCNKSFAEIGNLRKHIQLTHSGREKTRKEKNKTKVKCGDCPDKEFQTERDLISHKIKFHGADPFKCQFCGKEFQMWSHLSRHENEHKGVKRKVLTCDVAGCGKSFFTLTGLKEHQHKSKEHAGITNAFICGQCGKGFNYEAGLKTHEQCVHGTERAFVCDECGESFKLPSVLKRHMMIHTGEKPFQCDICQQRFRYKEVLKRHLKGHEKKGAAFRPNGPMKNVRKRVNPK